MSDHQVASKMWDQEDYRVQVAVGTVLSYRPLLEHSQKLLRQKNMDAISEEEDCPTLERPWSLYGHHGYLDVSLEQSHVDACCDLSILDTLSLSGDVQWKMHCILPGSSQTYRTHQTFPNSLHSAHVLICLLSDMYLTDEDRGALEVIENYSLYKPLIVDAIDLGMVDRSLTNLDTLNTIIATCTRILHSGQPMDMLEEQSPDQNPDQNLCDCMGDASLEDTLAQSETLASRHSNMQVPKRPATLSWSAFPPIPGTAYIFRDQPHRFSSLDSTAALSTVFLYAYSVGGAPS